MPYLVVIEDLSLQKKNNEDVDDLQMQILLMIYKNKYMLAEGIKSWSIPLTIPHIFKQGINSKDLYLWANKELRFLGLIKEAGAVFGVISDPLGGVYRVKVGDKVGLNNSVIAAINECGIKMVKKEGPAIYPS